MKDKLIPVTELVLHYEATAVALSSPDHGPRHWRDVARVAHGLWAEGVADADAELLFLFALLHDSQRDSEWDDPQHGNRAARLATMLSKEGLLHLDSEQLDKLVVAVTYHDTGRTSEDPTIGTCWDADRLTLGRIGKTPDPKYMSNDWGDKFEALCDWSLGIVTGKDIDWPEIIAAYHLEAPLDLVGLTRGGESVVPDKQLTSNERHSYAMLKRIFRGGELVPELQAAVFETPSLGTWLGHPLIHGPFVPQQAGHFNDMLKAKREAVEKYAREGNWGGYVFMHERPYRIQIFIEISQEIEDPAEWWELVRDVWIDSENIWQNLGDWLTIFEQGRSHGGDMMSDEDRAKLAEMPDELTVYRGTCAYDGMGSGLSWTLDKQRAEWFAKRLYVPDDERCGTPQLVEGKVKKTDVLGYMTGRGEEEIVALEDDVKVTSITELESVREESKHADA